MRVDELCASRQAPRPSATGLSLLVVAALLLPLAACTSARPRPGKVLERGMASWYGPKFHGRATASGEPFDMGELTAAHKTLPFGTVVEVVNLDNGKSVTVRINDRGPFVKRRIVDLSRAAAAEIDMIGPGVARVELRLAAASPPPGYTVQVAAFSDLERAELLRQDLARRYGQVTVASDTAWHRVRVGRFGERRKAERLRRELERLGFAGLVVALR